MIDSCVCGVTAAQPVFQPEGSGANPTYTLQFSQEVDCGKAARKFICDWHYSKKCPPAKFYFTARQAGRLVGVCVFNAPQLPKIAKCYGIDLELTRLVLLDECPKNSESKFIAWCLRWLGKNTLARRVVSFADPRFGHVGTIYKASNFFYAGLERGHGTRRIFVDEKEYHPKTAFDKWGCSGQKLSALLAPSRVEVKVMPRKHVYIFNLRA